jgi:hypothetical protein
VHQRERAPAGWSAAKVARWRAQRAEVAARDERVAASQDARWVTPALGEWLAALAAAVEVAPELGLYLHWYKGGLASERVDLSRRRRIARAALDLDVLRGLAEDELLVVHA